MRLFFPVIDLLSSFIQHSLLLQFSSDSRHTEHQPKPVFLIILTIHNLKNMYYYKFRKAFTDLDFMIDTNRTSFNLTSLIYL